MKWAKLLPDAARDRLLEAMKERPVWTAKDRTAQISSAASLSKSLVNGILARRVPLSMMAGRLLANAYNLDWDYITTEPEPVPELKPCGCSSRPAEGNAGEPSTRDWIAMSAMNALLTAGNPQSPADLALSAYAYADAMMEAREA